ncbi:MAG: glycosyltransferase family 2 protein [Gammaproteobacteria bacterium]|nr:glycosyltransferase family 2 protein [Gammaproteobacteria bacterium]
MDIPEILLITFAGLAAIPTLVFTMQILLAAGVGDTEIGRYGRRPSIAVLMPAHNEAAIIGETLGSILPQLVANDRLLVVADNCTDETSAIAKECGAYVIERRNENLRGKGYALDFGLQCLAKQNPPEVVIIIDADCQVSSDCIDTLARRASSENRPIQALYLMQAPAIKSVTQAIAEFAWVVKNQVRPLGFKRLGLSCQLMGTGMAFPLNVLSDVNLAHGNMVEDMKLGIDLALKGFAPIFCPDALVTSEFPTSAQVTATQRTRWEHGHLATIFAETPRLLKAAIQRRDASLLAMALDLSVPPLSVLGLMLLILFGFAGVLTLVYGKTLTLSIVGVITAIFAVAALLAWYRFGRKILAFKTLCAAPFYMLRKIPLYLAFIVKRQQDWVKTERR